MEQVCYNEEAWRILSLTALPPSRDADPPPNFSLICERWKGLLDKKLSGRRETDRDRETGSAFIDLYQSRRRRYIVMGVVLLNHTFSMEGRESHYLFILDRISPEGVNLSLVSRQWKLTRREKELVRLLLSEKSNKEIAHILGLSLNTVKGYLKLLMRRLGVGSRTGIIARLLTVKTTAVPIGSDRHPKK